MINIPKVLIKLHNILEISEECKKHLANKEFTKIKKDHNIMETSAKEAVDELGDIEKHIVEEDKRSKILRIKTEINNTLRNQYIGAVKRKYDILIIDPHRTFTKQGLLEDLEKINKTCALLINELARVAQLRGMTT